MRYIDPADRKNQHASIKENKMDTLKIGHYIQHLRKAAGMTQKELAEKLNEKDENIGE